MKIVIKILPNTVYNLSPPQARKNHFIWMGLLYGAFSPGTTCWPGGVPKCSTGVGVKKWPPGGVDLLFTPPPRTPMLLVINRVLVLNLNSPWTSPYLELDTTFSYRKRRDNKKLGSDTKIIATQEETIWFLMLKTLRFVICPPASLRNIKVTENRFYPDINLKLYNIIYRFGKNERSAHSKLLKCIPRTIFRYKDMQSYQSINLCTHNH